MEGHKIVRKANPRGKAGEEYAAGILQKQGYRILERNFSSKYGEIDIIAEKGGIIALVEVKTRKSGGMVSGFEAVTKTKQRKIIVTAMWYLQDNALEFQDFQPRFDVFSVETKFGEIISHEHLEGAFDSGAYPQHH